MDSNVHPILQKITTEQKHWFLQFSIFGSNADLIMMLHAVNKVENPKHVLW